MKVFISGPMSGKANYNREAFFKAEEELEKHGYSVWNPAWLAYPSDTEFTKDDMHIIDFAALRRCDAIYMLEGWKHSKGAQEEHEYAIMRGLMIMYEGAHCWGKEPEDEYDVIKRHIKTVEEALAWERWKNRLPVEAINVHNMQNTFKSELDSMRNKLNKYTHIIQALTGRPIDEIVKSWDMCDNGFGVNYRFNPNGRSTLDISMSRTKREVLLEKENEELKKRLKSAEQSDYVTPLRDRVDVCEEKINEVIDRANEHEEDLDTLEADLDDCKKDISEQDRRLDCHHNRLMSLSERVNTLSTQYKDCWYELQQARKDITDLVNSVCDDNRTINNTLTDLNVRLKAIEKRLSIKPFYAPTEDEKDDD